MCLLSRHPPPGGKTPTSNQQKRSSRRRDQRGHRRAFVCRPRHTSPWVQRSRIVASPLSRCVYPFVTSWARVLWSAPPIYVSKAEPALSNPHLFRNLEGSLSCFLEGSPFLPRIHNHEQLRLLVDPLLRTLSASVFEESEEGSGNNRAVNLLITMFNIKSMRVCVRCYSLGAL